MMLALHGFDVYGLEVSGTAVSVAKEYVRNEVANPRAYNFGLSREEGQEGSGEVTIIQGDFFKLDWDNGIKFDLIYDYTVCFCYWVSDLAFRPDTDMCSFCVPSIQVCGLSGLRGWPIF